MRSAPTTVQILSCEDATSSKSGNAYTRLWVMNDGAPCVVFPPQGFLNGEVHQRLRAGERIEASVVFEVEMDGKWSHKVSLHSLQETGEAADADGPKVVRRAS